MSLIRPSRCLPAALIRWRSGRKASASRSSASSWSISEYPMIAFSGVRSSWDMFARNCDLCWLATSSSRLVSSTCWNRRAFSIARTDWLANVWSRSTTACGNSPGVLRRITSAPTTRCSRTSGTASSARKPVRRRASRTGLGAKSVSASEVRDLDRLPAQRRSPDDVVVREAQPILLDRREQLGRHPIGGPGRERRRLARPARRSCRRRRRRGGRRARRWSSAPPGGRATRRRPGRPRRAPAARRRGPAAPGTGGRSRWRSRPGRRTSPAGRSALGERARPHAGAVTSEYARSAHAPASSGTPEPYGSDASAEFLRRPDTRRLSRSARSGTWIVRRSRTARSPTEPHRQRRPGTVVADDPLGSPHSGRQRMPSDRRQRTTHDPDRQSERGSYRSAARRAGRRSRRSRRAPTADPSARRR